MQTGAASAVSTAATCRARSTALKIRVSIGCRELRVRD